MPLFAVTICKQCGADYFKQTHIGDRVVMVASILIAFLLGVLI